MLRRHVILADSSRHTGCGGVVPWLLPAASSLAFLVGGIPTALAVPHQAKPAPQTLWNSFPLNPTGERLGPKVSVRPRTTASPSPRAPETVAGSSAHASASASEATTSSRADVIVVALVAAVGLVALFALVGLMGARLRYVFGPPAGFAPRPRWGRA